MLQKISIFNQLKKYLKKTTIDEEAIRANARLTDMILFNKA